ncbi:MAG: YezD family protein [Lachnospiraceae bacterium]|nr:YezD family protein [Lachnospiraceae bacterium]
MEKEQQQDTGYLDMIQKLITEIKFGTVTIIVQEVHFNEVQYFTFA